MKSKKILPLVLMLSTFALGSCGGSSSSSSTNPASSTSPASSSVAPSSTPATSSAKTSTTPTPFVDSRTFMLVGSGLGAEQELTWTPTFGDALVPTEHVKMTQEEGQNVYKLTVNLYADDEFKVVSTKGWDNGNAGFSNLQEAGANFEDHNGNIKVKVSATYTLTLTTTAPDSLVLTYTKGADLFKPVITYSYQLKGSWAEKWDDLRDMVADTTTPTLYKYEMALAENTEFGIQVNQHVGEKVVDGGFLGFPNVVAGTEGFVKAATSDNIICQVAGTYIISLDTADGNKISLTLKDDGGTTEPGTGGETGGDSGTGSETGSGSEEAGA